MLNKQTRNLEVGFILVLLILLSAIAAIRAATITGVIGYKLDKNVPTTYSNAGGCSGVTNLTSSSIFIPTGPAGTSSDFKDFLNSSFAQPAAGNITQSACLTGGAHSESDCTTAGGYVNGGLCIFSATPGSLCTNHAGWTSGSWTHYEKTCSRGTDYLCIDSSDWFSCEDDWVNAFNDELKAKLAEGYDNADSTSYANTSAATARANCTNSTRKDTYACTVDSPPDSDIQCTYLISHSVPTPTPAHNIHPGWNYYKICGEGYDDNGNYIYESTCTGIVTEIGCK